MPTPAAVRADLSVLSYANGFTLWHYTTADTLSDVTTTATYFDACADMVRVGDMILCTLDTDAAGTLAGAILQVSANTGTAVTVANLFAAVAA